jgi:hypothetical protein
MKHLTPFIIGTATLCAVATAALGADELLPGQVDFGAFAPPKGEGQYVEVNVPRALLSLAARLVEKDQPEAAKVISGLKLVRLNVIGLDADNRTELHQRAQKIRADLAAKGWQPIVTAQQRDQDATILLKMDDKGGVQGLVAVVLDARKDQAVFANVVGDIQPDQLAMLGDRLHLEHLKKLGQAGRKPDDKPKENPEK